MLNGVQPDNLVAVVVEGLQLPGERRRVVPPGLGLPDAARRRPGVLGRQPHRDRPQRAREVRPRWGGDHREQVRGRGPVDAEAAVGGDHERPQVEAVPLLRRNPVPVLRHEQVDCADERRLGQFRHGHPARRPVEPCRVRLRAERHDRAARLPVRLQALENLLRVVEHRGGGFERDRAVRLKLAVMPAPVIRPADRHHVVGEDLAEPGICQQPLPISSRNRAAGGTERKVDLSVRAGSHQGLPFTSAALPGEAMTSY